MMRGAGGRSGMTLIEVMLAVVILTTGLIALLTAASRCMAVVGQAKNYEVARRLIGEIDVVSPLRLLDEIQAGTESGGFDAPAGWTWTRTLAEVEEGDEESEGLFRMTLRVSWGGKRGGGFEEVSQYLFVPKNSDGVFTLKPKTL